MSGGNGGWRMSSYTNGSTCVEAFSMEWRKSSKSGTNGCVEVAFASSSRCSAGNCVEVGVARTSSRCTNGDCVEVEGLPEGMGTAPDGSPYVVAVRNSKRPEAGMVVFTAREWDAFLAGVKDEEFELAQ